MSRRWTGRAGLLASSLILMTGCGGSSAPSDDVPALGSALNRVDDAIVAGQYDDARSALDDLVTTTRNAREEGRLTRAEADRILAAAAQLTSALQEEPEPPEEPEAEPTDEPAEEPTEDPAEEPEVEPEPVDPEESDPTPVEPPEEETPSEEDSEEVPPGQEDDGEPGNSENASGNNGNGNGNGQDD